MKQNPTSEFERQRLDIPSELFSQGLQPNPFRIYFRLRYMSKGKSFVHVTHAALAKRLRMDDETVRRGIRHLERAGCISTSRSVNPFSGQPMNRYDFLPESSFRKDALDARA